MSLANIHPNAYYFAIPDYDLEGVIDTFEDPEGIFLRFSSRKVGATTYTFGYQAVIWEGKYTTKEECDVGIAQCLARINAYLAETIPKKDPSSVPEGGFQYVAHVVRSGLIFNTDTNQIETK